MKNFTDKVVAITGGATGIGFALAKAFGAEGARVALAGRRAHRLEEAVAALAAEGIEGCFRVCDVTDRAQVESFADYAWEAFGQVDVIVNNAGIGLPGRPALETPEQDVERVFAVNVLGVWRGVSVFGQRFLAQGTPAAIYNVASENALFHGVPLNAPYVASKHAVLALTEALREEVPDWIEVGLICPGFVRTEIGPHEVMARGMDPDAFAAKVIEQIREGAFFIVTHAHNMVHVDARYDEIARAYARYAPRYEGDDQYDVRSVIRSIQQERQSGPGG